MTLSHRWTSTTAACNTTADNVEERYHRLYMNGWSKAFQDAVTVTRRLGMPYLWIDSLCIIQSGDNGRDWKREALKMSQYYQHSVFTIAASNASEHGFLNPPFSEFREELVRLPYRDRDSIRRGSFFISRNRDAFGVAGKYGEDVLNGPLLRRGWIFQEWLLSRRIIHFLGDQIFFECQSRDPFNDFGESVRPKDLSILRFSGQSGDGLEHYSLRSLLSGNATASADFWFRIVQIYSGMKLTRPKTDRIPALAGLAAEFREVISSRRIGPGREPYLAGCWLRDLQRSLLWEQQDLGKRRFLSRRRPTWSWAASSNPVHWRPARGKVDNACEVLEVLSREESEDDTFQPPSTPRTAELLATSFDVDNDFACLLLLGKTELVLHGPALDESEGERIARYTGVPNEQTSRWTSIADPANPTEHIGWADVELFHNPEGTNLRRDRRVLLALHVCTMRMEEGLRLGAIDASTEAYCVLFLTPIGTVGEQKVPQYARAGTGRVYKDDFFKNAQEVVLRLV